MYSDGRHSRDRARLFGLGPGARRRGRVPLPFFLRLVLALALLATAPVALAAGRGTYEQARERAATEAATRHQVTARLTEDAWTPPQPGEGLSALAQAQVSWDAAPGFDRQEGVVHVPSAAVTGSTVTIWIDDQGRVAHRPESSSEVRGQGVATGMGALVGWSLLVFLAHLGCHAAMERSRLRRWAAEWAVVEPAWSREVI